MATASRRSTFDGLTTAAAEKWLNDNNAEDIVFRNTPTLALFNAMAEKKSLPIDLVIRLRDSIGEGAGPFEYYDTLDTTPIKGNTAARFNPVNYAAPLTFSDQEILEFTTPEAIYDAVSDRMQTQANTIADLLATDIFRGNTANAKRLTGLEQQYPDINHLALDGTAGAAETEPLTQEWQGRQAVNTYGGITRTAWTSSTDGTPWTGYSYQHFAGAGGFNVSSGAPNAPLRRLYEAIQNSTYGVERPNVIISGYQPYNDYVMALAGIQQIQRTGIKLVDGEMFFENIAIQGAAWFPDRYCKQYNSIGGDADLAEDTIYGLNTKYQHFLVDKRWNMTLSDERSPINQMAHTKFLLWRGQGVNYNPRMGFRYFNYATA